MSDIEQPATVEAPAPAGPRPGRVLAEARERRNQTVAEIAQQLKLSPHQIEALEADDYARLPGAVFVRGFVRNYARLVDLDGEALVARLELSQTATTAINAVPHSQNIPFQDTRSARWPLLAAAVALLAAIVLIFEWLMPDAAEAPASASAPVAVPLPVNPAPVLSVVEATETVAPAAPPVDVSAVQAVSSSAISAAATPPAVAVPAVIAPVASPAVPSATAAPVAAKPAAAGGSELRFVFERQSWVEVRDRNDRVVFSQLNPAGAMQTVQGAAPLNVVIGNAAGVKLSYKGKAVDLAPHTKTDVARLVLE